MQIVLFGDDLTCIYMIQKIKICLLTSLIIVGAVSVMAQSVTTGKPVYDYGDRTEVFYNNAFTNSDFYFYHNAALVPSSFFVERVTFDNGDFVTDVLEPGKYTVKNIFEGTEYAQSSFRIADIPLQDNDLRILVVADAHVMAQALVVGESEAYQNAMNSSRKMLAESEGVFNQLVDTVIKYKPDLVLFPGDMTKDGEKVSHQVFVNGLKRIEKQGIVCLAIPGNHDYNNPNSVYYASTEKIYTPTLTESEFAGMYKDYGYGDNSARDTSSLSYYTDKFAGLRIIGIDATRNRENTLKEWGAKRDKVFADGFLRPNTLKWVLDRADEAAQQGRMVFVMMHHQMLQHFNNQDKIFSSATIQSGDSIARVFMKHNIHVVLTGHMHINNATKLYNEEKSDSIIEISTGSPIEYPGCWRWLTINSKRNKITVNTRFVSAIAEAQDYMVYGRDLLVKHSGLVWTPIANYLWNKMRSLRNSTIGSQGPVSRFLDIMINNEDKYSAMMESYMSEPLKLVMLTAAEANENKKYGQLLIDMMTDGLTNFAEDVIADNNFNSLERTAIRVFVKNSGDTLFEEYLGSLIYDCSYCGTDNENTTNDLYLNLHLPAPVISGLENAGAENMQSYYYDMLGRRYTECPPHSGIYLHNGRKIIVR